MSSFEKIVKLACKPKNAPPKSKYIDNIIAATWSEDGAVHDVCKALAPRFREPNSVVVFKALIVLHTMIRNGATDNVLSQLSQSDILKLRNVYAGNWEGFENPDHLHHYAKYLDCRIRSYASLKHDVIKVQSESNRDLRSSTTLEEEEERAHGKRRRGGGNVNTGFGRSKTMMGRKLRSMTVEKGLLRETKVVHQMIDAVVECRFYLDGVDDELRLTALRMLVKDLLILFQAGNEAVINLLEQYFEMSHIDATEGLSIYRHFCKQTERVTEYLGVAKKLQNLLNVPIPNLQHAPVSLVTALQEYLDDPNFEQNRLEYRANRAATNGKAVPKSATSNAKASSTSKTEAESSTTSLGTTSATPAASQPLSKKSNIEDFFSSIEENQTSMFNAQASSPTGTPNPFSQMSTGQPFAGQVMAQPTGFIMPQHTAVLNSTNPFGLSGQQPTTSQRPFTTYLTAADQQNFLQPQATGINPFRQSMLVPQTTGMALFGVGSGPATGMSALGAPQQLNSNSFPTTNQSVTAGFGQSLFSTASSPLQQQQQQIQTLPFQPFPTSTSAAPSNSTFSTASQVHAGINVPPRPASTPLTNLVKSNSPPPLKPQMTGTRNPFGPIITPAPPVPKPPTMAELAGMGHGASSAPVGSQQQQQPIQASGGGPMNVTTSGFNFANSALNPGGTDMGSVASSFAFTNSRPNTTSPTSTSTATGSIFSDSTLGGSSFPGLVSQPMSTSTGSAIAATSSLPAGVGNGAGTSTGQLKPQTTGFAGLKAFKPSSSFGTALVNSLPPVPNALNATSPSTITGASTIPGAGTGIGSSLGTSEFGTLNRQQTSFGGGFGALNAGANGFGSSSATSTPTNPLSPASTTLPSGTSKLGVGLRPQLTGGGTANPFRASMAAGNSLSGFGVPGVSNVPPLPTGFGNTNMFGATPSSSHPFGNAFGLPQQGAGQTQGPQQGQGNASLI